MVKRICPNCKKEVDVKIIDQIWTPCDGNPLECSNCGVCFWRNGSLVIHNDTEGMIFHKDGKFFSKDKKGQIITIKLEDEKT